MMVKWIGAAMIVAASAGFGIKLSLSHKREVQLLRDIVHALDFMECELQYTMIALPELCRKTAAQSGGVLRELFAGLAAELEDQISPDVMICMQSAIARCSALPKAACEVLDFLGKSMGRFDLPGQLKGLQAVREDCRRRLTKLTSESEEKIRTYQTLGICAGAALAILLM